MVNTATSRNFSCPNAFGDPIPSIAAIALDESLNPTIKSMLQGVLSRLGVKLAGTIAMTNLIVDAAQWSDRVPGYEKSMHDLLVRHRLDAAVSEVLSDRAGRIVNQIGPFVPSGRVLDIGCGDGGVGKLLAGRGSEVTLCDVYQHRTIARLALPFKPIYQGETLPFAEASFEAGLLLTVLHHSNDPCLLVSEAARVIKPGGRLIVIESAFGVQAQPWDLEPSIENETFCRLPQEQQRLINIFFDHFYNRVVHYSDNPSLKVNVPFNFNTPGEWQSIFGKFGLKQIHFAYLGIDQPVVPEFHTLHVCEKAQ